MPSNTYERIGNYLSARKIPKSRSNVAKQRNCRVCETAGEPLLATRWLLKRPVVFQGSSYNPNRLFTCVSQKKKAMKRRLGWVLSRYGLRRLVTLKWKRVLIPVRRQCRSRVRGMHLDGGGSFEAEEIFGSK